MSTTNYSKTPLVGCDFKNYPWLAESFIASDEGVEMVLTAHTEDGEGRTDWLWIRLNNGDLILGVYPQGETYGRVLAIVAADYRKALDSTNTTGV
jgi:hypothetical protein